MVICYLLFFELREFSRLRTAAPIVFAATFLAIEAKAKRREDQKAPCAMATCRSDWLKSANLRQARHSISSITCRLLVAKTRNLR
jgi:hypothetical protein